MNKLSNEIKVGLFTIITVIVLVTFSLKTTGGSLFKSVSEMKFYVHFDSAAGLKTQSMVKLSGLKVGYIESIKLEGTGVKVVVKLSTPVRINKNSIAVIRTSGLLGDSYLDIIQVLDGDEWISDGDILVNSQTPTDISELVNKSSKILEDLGEVTESLQIVFGSSKAQNDLGGLLSNLSEATNILVEIMQTNQSELNESLKNFNSASLKFDNMMSNFETVATKIGEGEGTIGRLVTDEEIYEKLNETLDGTSRLLGQTGGFHLNIDGRLEKKTDNEYEQGYFGFKISPREDRYYLVELTTDVRAKEADEAGSSIDDLLYTLMMAKRYSDLTLKAGIVESSLGVGLDFHMFEDSLMLKSELFNLSGYDSTSENAQLKMALRWNAYKYLYFYAGVDELLNDKYKSYLLGIGLNFDDDDLKLALGFL